MGSFKTKNEVVYDYLRTNILEKKFRTGEKIVIRQIAQKLNVSDIPVREAITKLASEGFLTALPHVGARVIKITPSEMEEFYILRSDLEALATRLAAKYMQQEDFEKLDKILDRWYSEAIREGKREVMVKLNRQFHMEIYKCSPYHGLCKMIADIWDKCLLIRHAYRLPSALHEESIKEHRQILEHLKKGNGKAAARIVERQKIASWNSIARYIEE
jgi:DNA-binding GntR family transcriptional regulator